MDTINKKSFTRFLDKDKRESVLESIKEYCDLRLIKSEGAFYATAKLRDFKEQYIDPLDTLSISPRERGRMTSALVKYNEFLWQKKRGKTQVSLRKKKPKVDPTPYYRSQIGMLADRIGMLHTLIEKRMDEILDAINSKCNGQ